MQCSVAGCLTAPRTPGSKFCQAHYMRQRRRGGSTDSRTSKLLALNHQWRGDDASYSAIHYRLRTHRGRACEHACSVCGNPAAHWAFDEPSGFSADLSRYTPMCVPCHRKHDYRLKELTNA